MRSVFRLPIYTTAAACAALVLSGCGGGGGGGGTTPVASTFDLVGRVFSAADGAPVSGANVALNPGNQTATTDASGVYRIPSIATTFSGGTVGVTAGGFESGTSAVTNAGSGLQVSGIGLTPTGTPQSINPATGGTIQQGSPEAPGLPSVAVTFPPNSLPSNVTTITLTVAVNQPGGPLVSSASVKGQAVGDTSSHAPEVEVRFTPGDVALNLAAPITLPLPFALQPGQNVPILQFTSGAWREVGTAVVDAGGMTAQGHIPTLAPTGVEAWHDLQYTTTNQPPVNPTEVTLSSIQNDINNLPDRSYVVRSESNGIAEITARFAWAFQQSTLPTSPVNEEVLCLGLASVRDRIGDSFAAGKWSKQGGAVRFNVHRENVTVKRMLDSQFLSDAGTFSADHGKPNWPLPPAHNQGGVQ